MLKVGEKAGHEFRFMQVGWGRGGLGMHKLSDGLSRDSSALEVAVKMGMPRDIVDYAATI